ncbi:cupin-like domain-containing protein [Xanthomarina sp. GH4-25]|uniref:cupin-like domain-containing protein n=1 Tax=Xanthomarina sp. GH4-25 TaxID=3349335 RepID=UPI000D67C3AC|nr:cupin [Flavobacteriaceae bacterium LYZ1037]
MLKLNLQDIPRVKSISKQDFIKHYYKPQKPVVVEQFIEDWPAFSKWTLDYFKEIAGEKMVSLYDDRPVSYSDGFNEAHAEMPLKDYIHLLQNGSTKYRIFLWNILKEVPELQNDYKYPDLGLKLLKKLPMLFFGGKDSYTFMHYDIDLANIFHFHFEGEKEVILFDQNQSKYLYKIPHALITREDIDFSNPDVVKWPALKQAKGFKTQLNHGDMLYMPEGYWHYMKYKTTGFSLSLRAIPKNPIHLSKAVYNLLIMRHFDNAMRRIQGQKWIDWKNERAIKKTTNNLIT